MPVTVQHTILFLFVFIMIVATLLSTTYIIAVNMISDTYRYEKVLEKANEKLRLAGIIEESKLYYGVRNIALVKVAIKELGVIDASGSKHVLATDVELDPGEAFTGSTVSYYGSLYAITERGNVFSAPIFDFESTTEERQITIRSLLPSYTQVQSPISYRGDLEYTVGVGTYGYVFGFLFADDPYSNSYVHLVFHPQKISDLFKNRNIPYRLTQSRTNGPVSASAELVFEIVDDKRAWPYPYYKITMPIDVRRTDAKSGLLVRGCVGFIWRTISNNVFGYEVENSGRSYCLSSQEERVCDDISVGVLPVSLDIDALIPELAGGALLEIPASAPSGSQVYIVYAKCFYVESDRVARISTTYISPWTMVRGVKINTYLVFPGKTAVHTFTYTLNEIRLKLRINPKVLLLTLLEQI